MAALPHSGDAVYYHEVWAGSLVILSATAYALGRWRWGMLALVAALAFREFVLLPVAVAVVFALYERRWAELLAWAVALPLYAGLWALHFAAVSRHLGPVDQLLPPRSWLAFGGAHFLILATRVDMLWFYLPSFVNALALPLALFGYGDWRNAGATRMGLTLLGFMLAFSVIGLPCNGYWGFLFLPLLSIGLVRFPLALQELVGAIRRPAQLATLDPTACPNRSPSSPSDRSSPTAAALGPLADARLLAGQMRRDHDGERGCERTGDGDHDQDPNRGTRHVATMALAGAVVAKFRLKRF